MMPKKDLCTGFFYSTDSWKNYWEGSLKRDNLNMGTITTKSITWMGAYGVTEKINLIAMLPYVWTNSSGPTLHPIQGIQDLTLAGKYSFFKKDIDKSSIKTFLVVSGSMPLTNYTIDYLPMAIGFGSKTLSLRLNANYTFANRWYAGVSGAYVMRSNIHLDRTSYLRNNQLMETNEVSMPNQFHFFGNIGYKQKNWLAEITYMQQTTLDGDDIRRQATPELWDRFNYSKVGINATYDLPKPKGLVAKASTMYTVAGLNVGQSTTYSFGLLYTFHFKKNEITQ